MAFQPSEKKHHADDCDRLLATRSGTLSRAPSTASASSLSNEDLPRLKRLNGYTVERLDCEAGSFSRRISMDDFGAIFQALSVRIPAVLQCLVRLGLVDASFA